MQRGGVCCETRGRNRSAVLLADFLFSGSPAAYHFSPTHTRVPKAFSPPFFCCSLALSLPHCPRSISSSRCLPETPSPTETHIHTHTGVKCCNCNQMKSDTNLSLSLFRGSPLNSSPPTWEPYQPMRSLMLIFVFMMGGGQKRAAGCSH